MNVRKFGKILLFASAGFVCLLLVLLLAVKLTVDRAPAYQNEIKAWVYRQTGLNIAFAHVSPSLRWYGPELYFDQLELRSKDDRRVLARAAGGRIGADIWQLLRSGKLFAARVELVSPDIAIARLGPNRFALGSEIELNRLGSTAEAITLDDVPAGTLTIRSGRLTVQNWNPSLPRLLLDKVNLVMRRDSDAIAVQFDAGMPPALGGILSVRGEGRGLADLASLAWSTEVRARDISFAGWRRLLPEYLDNLTAGGGAFGLSAAGRGANLTRGYLDFDAQAVGTRLGDGSVTNFDRISGIITLTHTGDRWSLAGRRVLALQAGRKEPASQFDVAWRGGDAGLLELRARASYLRADSLLPLAGLLQQQDIRDRLLQIAPTGEWSDAYLELSRAAPADPWQMRVQAKFREVGFAPVGQAPGFRGLSGAIAGNQDGGHVQLDAQTVLVAWPAQWTQPISLDTLQGTFYWSRTAERLLIATPTLAARNPDAELHARVALRLPASGDPPVLDLVSQVENGNVANAHYYLPRGLIAPKALEWLDRAFVAGHMSLANVDLHGPLTHFPFRDGSGQFLVRLGIDGMILDYGEGWPLIENMSGQGEFRNEGLTVRVAQASASGIKVESGDARFADFQTGELAIHGTASGDAAAAVNFLRATPLNAMADGAFSDVEAQGPVHGSIELFLPFKDFDKRRVLVHAIANGVTLNRAGLPLTATEINGNVDIDGAQVAHADIRGRLLGGGFRMLARAPKKRPLTRTELDLRGTLSGDALRGALGLPPSFTIDGVSEWRATVNMAPEPARERSLRVTTSFAGLESKLPEPLRKPAGQPMPSWMEVHWPAGTGPQVNLSLGSVVRAAFAFEPEVDGLRLAHGAVLFGGGDPVFSDSQVLSIGGRIERLELDRWQMLNTRNKDSKPLSYYLHSAKLDAGEIDYLGLSFQQVGLELSESADRWRLALAGPNIAGTVTVPAGAEPWDLQFERLRVDDSAATAIANAGSAAASDAAPGGGATAGGASVTPSSVPALKFRANELNWGDRHLGNVQAALSKIADGVSIDRITVTNPSFNIKAQGEWSGSDAGQGRLSGTLNSSDVRTTLTQLGYADVIAARTGRVDFDLNWAGAPAAEAMRDSVGHVRIALDRGQVIGIKPGAGRVLGLASVAELPRRLALDFSDLTDKGLAFDTVRGDFDLRGGDAYTDNLLLKGPAAEIGLIGRVGLKNRDYDQTAVVTGSVGNSLPIASALVGGPVVGAAVLLFTQVFKQPLSGLARGYYRISGSWDNPTVDRIKSAEAAAATAEVPK